MVTTVDCASSKRLTPQVNVDLQHVGNLTCEAVLELAREMDPMPYVVCSACSSGLAGKAWSFHGAKFKRIRKLRNAGFERTIIIRVLQSLAGLKILLSNQRHPETKSSPRKRSRKDVTLPIGVSVHSKMRRPGFALVF